MSPDSQTHVLRFMGEAQRNLSERARIYGLFFTVEPQQRYCHVVSIPETYFVSIG